MSVTDLRRRHESLYHQQRHLHTDHRLELVTFTPKGAKAFLVLPGCFLSCANTIHVCWKWCGLARCGDAHVNMWRSLRMGAGAVIGWSLPDREGSSATHVEGMTGEGEGEGECSRPVIWSHAFHSVE